MERPECLPLGRGGSKPAFFSKNLTSGRPVFERVMIFGPNLPEMPHHLGNCHIGYIECLFWTHREPYRSVCGFWAQQDSGNLDHSVWTREWNQGDWQEATKYWLSLKSFNLLQLLCDEVHVNLAYRWFCRLDLGDPVRA